MSTTVIRKQGGAAIVTIPADILKRLDIDIGSKLEITVDNNDNLLLHLIPQTKRKRYTLKELLTGVTVKKMKALNKELESTQEGEPVGLKFHE